MNQAYGRAGSRSNSQRQPRQHVPPSVSHGQKKPYIRTPPVRDLAQTASIVKTRAFKRLVDTAGAENIALALDSNLSRIAERTNGDRFTPETAFHIETTLGLPDGFFDQSNPALTPDVVARLRAPLDHRQSDETKHESVEIVQPVAPSASTPAENTTTHAVLAEDIEMPRNKSSADVPAAVKTGGAVARDKAVSVKVESSKTAQKPTKAAQQTLALTDLPSIYEIRRANLHVLTARNGTKAQLGRLLNLSQSNMAHRLHGQKRMDDAETHRIIAALGLPTDWLDQPRESGDVPDAVINMLAPASRSRQPSLAAAPALERSKTKVAPPERPKAKASNNAHELALRESPKPASGVVSELERAARQPLIDADPVPALKSELSSNGVIAAQDTFPSTAATDLGTLRGIHPIAEALLKTLAGKARIGRLDEMKALELLHQAILL